MLEQRFRGRFELHDLLREYAREQAERHGGDHLAARGRLLQWYVHSAADARSQLTEVAHLLPVAAEPPEGIAPERFSGYRAAVEWFDAEQDTIVKIVQSVEDDRHREAAAVLGQLTWPYFYLRGLWQQMRVAGESAVEHAVAIQNPLVEAKIRNGLSVAYGLLEGFAQEEIATSRNALSIFERLDDRRGQAGALLNLGAAYNQAERFAEAQEALERASELFLQDGNQLYATFALNNLGLVYKALNQLDDALDCAHRVVDALRGTSEPFRWVAALMNLADVHAARGDRHAAIQGYRDAIAAAESCENTSQAIPLRVKLGHQLSAVGAEQDAVEVWREAYEICRAQDHPSAQEVERLLNRCTNGTLVQ
jgi:tetratricopeptide (TPR) repeat protein